MKLKLAFFLGALFQEMDCVKKQDKQPAWHLAKQALSHPERTEMLAHITRKGVGADATELSEALGLSTGKTRYHLMVLCNAGLAEQADDAGGRYVAVLSL